MVPRSAFQVSRFAFWFGFAVLTAVTVNGQAPRNVAAATRASADVLQR